MFRAAKEAALDSDFKVRVGAVITKNGSVCSKGHSSEKTSPVMARYNKYRNFDNADKYVEHKLHAEIQALCKLKNRTSDTIYVYRETADGVLALSRPCPACMAALRNAGIRNIYYTGNNSYIYERLGGIYE